MATKALEIERPYRDPRIKITGRTCALCLIDATPALVLNMVGELQARIFICVPCIVKASYDLAARRDVVINIETHHNTGGKVIHA
jgi:hypothetical protein